MSDDVLSFIGMQIYGLLACAGETVESRREALSSGETLSARGVTGIGQLLFYDTAIESCLIDERWEDADHQVASLEAFMASEPFAWGEFIAERGRAISRVGRGENDGELAATLRALEDRAREADDLMHVPAIEDALAQIGGGEFAPP